MGNPIDLVLSRLEGVKKSTPGRWSAKCPAHADRSPSLSVRELDDGRVLLHCFGGCGVDQVVGALGVEVTDLFPERRDRAPGAGTKRERKPFNAADLLRLAAHESLVCVLVTADIVAGRPADRPRLIEAAKRLQDLAEVTNGAR